MCSGAPHRETCVYGKDVENLEHYAEEGKRAIDVENKTDESQIMVLNQSSQR